jgi:hypothetical protein
MCTVTIIPNGNQDFILTSNRDESPNRVSLAPDFYDVDGAKLLFPKDTLSGGTWIGVSDRKRLVCVLNGGFVSHQRQSNYRKSRGIVTQDFLVSDDISATIESYNLEGIEPFTMIIPDWNTELKLYELVWDGLKKHVNELPLEPKIWSSSTLYDQVMKLKRQQWFGAFKDTHHDLNAATLLKFHKTAGQGNNHYSVIMDRGFVKTTSITQVSKVNGALNMYYENIETGQITTRLINKFQNANE